MGKLAKNLEAYVSLTIFQSADISTINASLMRKAFLGKTFFGAYPSQIRCKNPAQIHAPRKTCCRLLTHRFKPTK
jgi:hypothetical protein